MTTLNPRTAIPGPAVAHPQAVVLGVDIGTTAVKVGAFDTRGLELASAFAGYRLYEPREGYAEQDPHEIVEATLFAIRQTAEAARGRGAQISGLCVSAAMHGLLALDAQDRPIGRLITWADTRAFEEAEWLSAEHPELHDRTGTPLHPMAPLAKLLWLRRHDRARFDSARRWVGMKEMILARLADEWVIDHSSASGTGLFDLATLDWDPEALELARVTPGQLCPPVLATTTLPLSRPAAHATGLAPAMPVVIGAGDGALANLGLGAVRPGTLACSIGTSGALRLMVERPVLDRDHRLFCYAFLPGRWLVGGAINNGGSVLEWLGRILGDTEPDRLLAPAATVPPGSDGLVMLPYLLGERAPHWSALPRGAYVGLKHSHGRGHLVRAALEGVCQQLALVYDSIRAAGNEVREVRATGGFARSPLWRQMLCDVLGVPIGFAAGEQGAAVGAALLGMEALGAIESIDIAAATVRITDEITPDPAAVSMYRRQRPLFDGLYGELEPAFRRLRALAQPEPDDATQEVRDDPRA
jgi:gluconokinase